LTRISADKNIDHGDNSRSAVGTDVSGLAATALEAGAASVAGGCDALGDAAGVWTGAATGADGVGICTADGVGRGGTACCCAIAGDASDNTVSVVASEYFIRRVLNIAAFIPRPNSE
jgi:hypothetical protein